jgi:hypothetical protein
VKKMMGFSKPPGPKLRPSAVSLRCARQTEVAANIERHIAPGGLHANKARITARLYAQRAASCIT